MRGERGSSKADTLVKVTLVFFISLLSFSVGTFVGKQVSDSEHRKLALEGEFKGEGREVASAEGAEDEHGEGGEADAGKISEKEVASLTEEFVNKESEAAGGAPEEHAEAAGEGKDGYKTYGRKVASVEHGEKAEAHGKAEKAEEHGEAEAHEKSDKHEKAEVVDKHEKHEKKAKGEKVKPAEAVRKAAEKLNDATHRAAEKVAEGLAPSDGEAEKPKAKAGLPPVESSTVGKYTVQVASYPEEADAKARAEELKGKGYQSFYLPAKVNGKTWYRVLLGMFPTIKMAEEYKARIIKEGGTKAALVQKIVQ